MTETDKKREAIIEVALRRFSHFGIPKTTMSEIAEDASMKKAAMYYYFPDKPGLVMAVARRLSGEYLERLEKLFQQSVTTEEALHGLINIRKDFFQRYFMLHMGDDHPNPNDPAVKELMTEMKQREMQLVANVFKAGINRGELRNIDVEKTSHLFLDAMMGLRFCIHMEKQLLPSPDMFDDMMNKQKDLADIFLYGIKEPGRP